MSKKIIYLPLDERPCNYEFPFRLFSRPGFSIVRPPKLGNKKQAANIADIASFLKEECRDADGLILSVDMLLYGGLVPSRLHQTDVETLRKTAATLWELRAENPGLLIYAFHCIMRCPSYSSNDEEPDYYETCGEYIHGAGVAIHKNRLGQDAGQELANAMAKIDEKDWKDYVTRRESNLAMNLAILEYVADGTLDFLIIPQDDSAAYGHAAMDQQEVRTQILKKGLQEKVLMYPGADEVGLTLFSRILGYFTGVKPKIYVKYACEAAKFVLPIYEGNSLDITVRYQILAAGAQLTGSSQFADIILVVTAPGENIEEAVRQPSMAKGYCTERCLPEIMDFIAEQVQAGKTLTIADNAYGNGGELQLIHMLNRRRLLDKVAGYAGWNTSANTLGTAIAEGIAWHHWKSTPGQLNFLMERYIEDAGYCSLARWNVNKKLAEYGMDYFNVKSEDGIASQLVEHELKAFIIEYMSSVAQNIQQMKVCMPWRRMFEIGLTISYNTKDSLEKTERKDGDEAKFK